MSASLLVVPCDQDAAATVWLGIPESSITSLSTRFVLNLSPDAELTISRVLTDATGAVFASDIILSRRAADQEDGRLLLEAAGHLSAHASVVGRAAMLAGADWFDARIDAIARRLAAKRSAAIEQRRVAAEAAERLHRRIDVFFRGKHDFILDLQRGDAHEPFWSITFSERWERDRFWDWLRWQRDRFGSFADAAVAEGALALRGALLREMLETERAAKTAGLAAAGRRPLRFWCGALA